MPLTMCHPAAAIPFRKAGLPLSALIIGSMMPDFEFFFRLSTGKDIGHTFHGLFLFCIPVGLLILFVFHKLVKFPLLSLLPHNQHASLLPAAQRFRFFPLKNFIGVISALLVGALTHIVWDAFTHPDSLLVQAIPFFQLPLITLPQGTVRIYFFLQYATSFLGILVMAMWYMRWYKTNVRPNAKHLRLSLKKRVGIGFTMSSFALGGGVTYGFNSIPHLETVETLKRFLTYSSIATVSGFLVSVVTFGILWHLLIPDHKRKIIVQLPSSEG